MKTIVLILISTLYFQNSSIFTSLPGTWQMKMPEGILYETWTSTGENKLSGTAYMLKGADSSVFERTSLSVIDKEIYYTAVVANQNNGQPVRFKLANTIGKYFVFENKAHDFPQRVIYEFVSADSIHARIEGKKNGKDVAEDFFYSRKK
jgi:hypothetical protein